MKSRMESKMSSPVVIGVLIPAAKVLLMRPHNWARYGFCHDAAR
jgi:hypothetical protein